MYFHKKNSRAPSRSGSLLLRVSLDFDLERGIRGVPTGVTPGVLNPLTPSFSSTGRGLSCSMLCVRRLSGLWVDIMCTCTCKCTCVCMCITAYDMWRTFTWVCAWVYVTTSTHDMMSTSSQSLSLSFCVLFLPTPQLFEIWDVKLPP